MNNNGKTSNSNRERILARRKAANKQKYATLVRVATENPQLFTEAFTELSGTFRQLAAASDRLMNRLNITAAELPQAVSKTASIRDRIQAKRAAVKYASGLRRVTADAPESFANAMQEFYEKLDEVADGLESMAENVGIELPMVSAEPADVMGADVPLDPAADAGAAAPALPPAEGDELGDELDGAEAPLPE
jgi:myo-inositol-hexaphosphate 3-phosphohydrolase